jgi:hypothetical protein
MYEEAPPVLVEYSSSSPGSVELLSLESVRRRSPPIALLFTMGTGTTAADVAESELIVEYWVSLRGRVEPGGDELPELSAALSLRGIEPGPDTALRLEEASCCEDTSRMAGRKRLRWILAARCTYKQNDSRE